MLRPVALQLSHLRTSCMQGGREFEGIVWEGRSQAHAQACRAAAGHPADVRRAGGGGQCEGVRELCTMGRFSHILRRVALQVSHLRTSCRSYYGWEVLRRSAMGSGESRCR